tara:strand:- start:303 stop:1247 length:945 start_codon:yes stop_codon:yes gene_type:complete
MINSVRNTVLSILNKNNYGYISPSDFNLFSKQAQMDLFNEYFYQYNRQINKENARSSGTGYADITKGIEEVIDMFSVTSYMHYGASNKFLLPSATTTGDDYYLINKALVYEKFRTSGANTSVSGTPNELVDSTATFTATVAIGDIVVNTTTYTSAEVISIVSDNVLSLDADIFTATPQDYSIFLSVQNEAEKVNHSKITMLNSTSFTAPSEIFPVYTEEGILMSLFPKTIIEPGRVVAQYIRYPKEPKWTYILLPNGEPAFDSTRSDYQDFELTLDDEVSLVTRILQYAGMSIREIQIVQFAQAEEQQANQTEA